MRFGFYVSGRSGRLSKFLSEAEPSLIEHIQLVYSDECLESKTREIIEDKKIRTIVLPYSDIQRDSRQEKNLYLSNSILKNAQLHSLDYIFSFGSHILSGELLEKYKYRIINFHPSILPLYPGINAIDQAVEQGKSFLVGNTAHFIDEGIDTGPIIMQSVLPIRAFELTKGDYNIILDLQVGMLKKLMHIIIEDRLVVRSGKPEILGADYRQAHIFPSIT